MRYSTIRFKDVPYFAKFRYKNKWWARLSTNSAHGCTSGQILNFYGDSLFCPVGVLIK